jgi:hypothetical protein
MVETTVETKRCTGPCGLEKPLSEFHKHKQCKDGICSYCKACHKQKMDAQVERRRDSGDYKEPTTKRCSGPCKQIKTPDEFHNDSRQPDGKARQCKECAQKRSKARTPEQNRRYNLKKAYGITLEDYDRMLSDQGGKCAICGTDNPGSNETHFHVDHDHDTRKVRGLLCERCNIGIGYFDTPVSLERAANYLRSFN